MPVFSSFKIGVVTIKLTPVVALRDSCFYQTIDKVINY